MQNLFSRTKCISLNSHPFIDNPFAIHLAIAHSRKQQILVGQISAEANRFHREQELSTVGRVIELAFSGNCLCYANDSASYFVHNLNEKNAIHLFDASIPRISHVICTFGMVCLSGKINGEVF